MKITDKALKEIKTLKYGVTITEIERLHKRIKSLVKHIKRLETECSKYHVTW